MKNDKQLYRKLLGKSVCTRIDISKSKQYKATPINWSKVFNLMDGKGIPCCWCGVKGEYISNKKIHNKYYRMCPKCGLVWNCRGVIQDNLCSHINPKVEFEV